MELGDLHLNRSDTPPLEPEPRDRTLQALIGAILVVAIFAGGYFWWSRRSPAKTAAPAPVAQSAPPPAPPAPVAGEAIDLPPLGQSDALVRQLVGRLSSHPRVAQWLATDQLVRNFAVVVTNISNGHPPTVHLQSLRPTGRFMVTTDEGGSYIDSNTYRRYDGYADAVSSLDPQGTARVYETLKPRIQDAYRELGYPDADFDGALKRAIVLLLQTPVVEGRIGVAGIAPLFGFTDERLESLAGAQRQLLRMGPRNERIVQDKLRAIAPLVGIAPQDLPPPRVIREKG